MDKIHYFTIHLHNFYSSPFQMYIYRQNMKLNALRINILTKRFYQQRKISNNFVSLNRCRTLLTFCPLKWINKGITCYKQPNWIINKELPSSLFHFIMIQISKESHNQILQRSFEMEHCLESLLRKKNDPPSNFEG